MKAILKSNAVHDVADLAEREPLDRAERMRTDRDGQLEAMDNRTRSAIRLLARLIDHLAARGIFSPEELDELIAPLGDQITRIQPDHPNRPTG